MNNELFIIIIIILVLWFINNNTIRKKSNKPEKKDLYTVLPNKVYQCSLMTCPIIGEVCTAETSYLAGQGYNNWICNDKKIWTLSPNQPPPPAPAQRGLLTNNHPDPLPLPNAESCQEECTINGEICIAEDPGSSGYNWICRNNYWVALPTEHSNASECSSKSSCPINEQLCVLYDDNGPNSYSWICHDNKWVLPT